MAKNCNRKREKYFKNNLTPKKNCRLKSSSHLSEIYLWIARTQSTTPSRHQHVEIPYYYNFSHIYELRQGDALSTNCFKDYPLLQISSTLRRELKVIFSFILAHSL